MCTPLEENKSEKNQKKENRNKYFDSVLKFPIGKKWKCFLRKETRNKYFDDNRNSVLKLRYH